jgi:hypothetical protein
VSAFGRMKKQSCWTGQPPTNRSAGTWHLAPDRGTSRACLEMIGQHLCLPGHSDGEGGAGLGSRRTLLSPLTAVHLDSWTRGGAVHLQLQDRPSPATYSPVINGWPYRCGSGQTSGIRADQRTSKVPLQAPIDVLCTGLRVCQEGTSPRLK